MCVLSCLLQSPRGRLFPGSSARTHSSQLAKMCVCLCVCMWLVCLCKSEASVDGWRMNSSAPLLMFWVVPRSVAHGQKDTMLLHASVSGGGGRVLWERGMNPPPTHLDTSALWMQREINLLSTVSVVDQCRASTGIQEPPPPPVRPDQSAGINSGFWWQL